MAEEIITKAVTDQVAEAVVEEVVEEAIKQEVAKMPAKVSLNGKAVLAGAGIALSLIGVGIGTYKLVKVIKKSRAEKKAVQEENSDRE